MPITTTQCPGCDLALTPEMLDGKYRVKQTVPKWFGVAVGVAIVLVAVGIAIWQYVTVTHTFLGLRFLAILGLGLVGVAIAVVSYMRQRRPA